MREIRLDEAVNIQRKSAPAETIKSGSLVIGLENVVPYEGILELPDPIVEKVRSNKTYFQQGDILFGKLRPNLRKVVVAPINGFCTTELIVLRAIDERDTWYIWNLLRGVTFAKSINSLIAGASLPRISPRDLLSIEIAWPDEKQRFKISKQAEILHNTKVNLRNLQKLVADADSALSLSQHLDSKVVE